MMYIAITARLATYNEDQDNWYREFLPSGWTKRWQGPSWFDKKTRGCRHPDGVIIAGSEDIAHGMKVALIDLTHKRTVPLPDLDYPVTDVGITYDDVTEVLTVAGSDKYDANGGVELSKAVYRLSELSTEATWTKLEDLPDVVASPMLVNDNAYVYVLGGVDSVRCVRMLKTDTTNWRDIKVLPSEVGIPVANKYSGGVYGGALLYKHQVRVLTTTECLTYESNNTWSAVPYSGTRITKLTPVLHKGDIVACVQRGHPGIAVERFEIALKSWSVLSTTPYKSGIGAGRITSYEPDRNN